MAGELATAARVLAPRRGRRPSVHRDEVLAVALRLVDEQGLAALTMRDLARELGVAVGTVYSAAGSKEEILQGLADLVLGELPAVDGLDWRDALVAMFTAVHRQLTAHPSVAQLSVLEPLVGPGKSASHATVFAVLKDGGLSDAAAAGLYTTLASYTLGFTLYRVSRGADGAGRGRPGLKLTDKQFVAGLRQIVDGVTT